MTYQAIYSNTDFPEMGWHDATVYSMKFPGPDFAISFDIDYIFKWHVAETGTKFRGWDVAPCTLTFLNISGLKVSLDWCAPDGVNQGDTSILDIQRQNSRLTPNGKLVCWDYEIELDIGVISFTCTGFVQVVRIPPTFSESQYLGRPHAFDRHETESL